MNKKKVEKYRKQLVEMSARLRGDIATLEDQARAPTSGQAAGNLSNAPMHLGDVGTEVYLQELNATLLENEEYLRVEVLAALARIEQGAYGDCENCGQKIIEERLELLPYTRYCTPCAQELQAGKPINLNEGRPRDAADLYHPHDARVDAAFKGTDYTNEDVKPSRSKLKARSGRRQGDIHAAGTAGGGTAEGGLAGTNVGEGDPANADLEGAMGSGTHDVAIEADDEETIPYSGPAGGTPASKRAVGGKKRGGITPRSDPDEPTSG
jgi:RNA polymerase-binding transcription factor DksA